MLLSLIAFALQAQLIEHSLLKSYSEGELLVIRQNLGIPEFFISIDYPVDVYKLTYQTPDPRGNMTIATGAFCIPQGISCAPPLTSYQHGTVAGKTDVPSYMSAELNIGLMLATAGYSVALPDYLGLGDSPGLHPYVHAKSEATASLDMLRAARSLQEFVDFRLNDQLMIFGYSQGGHATMALHKEIEENASEEFEVTLSVPMSGPYDISGVQADVIIKDEFYPTPGYLPYVLLAYQDVYGNLFNEVSEVFKPPYDKSIPPLFDGSNSMAFINSQCPSIPNRMLQDSVLENFKNDPNHRLRIVLEDNDLYKWLPEAPVYMLYCEGDDQVNYMNSVVALAEFEANGLTNVEARNLGDGDHSDCFTPALFTCKTLMDDARIFNSGVEVSADINNEEGNITVTVTDGDGPFMFEWDNGNTSNVLTGQEAGVYSLVVTDVFGCQKAFSFEIEGATSVASNLRNSSLAVNPNPVSMLDQARIILPQNDMHYSLEVYSINGQKVFSQKTIIGNEFLLPPQNQAGVYVLKLTSEYEVYLGKWLVE